MTQRKAHNRIDLTGQRFGDLVVIAEADKDKYGRLQWKCKCDCGGESIALGNYLRQGETTTCGCGRLRHPRNLKHGHTSKGGKRVISRAYVAWYQMRQRCDNPKVANYADYGGRGISYDPRWKDFSNFLADMGDSPKGKSLDRKNNAKGYFRANCRWATRIEQNRNQRSNIAVSFNGKTMLISEWAEHLGLKYITLYNRLVTRKWSVEKALLPILYDRRGRPMP